MLVHLLLIWKIHLTIAFAMANSGENPEDIENIMNKEYNKLKSELISDRELEKIRNQIESDFISSNSRMDGIAESLANYYLFYKNTNLINEEINRYLAVTKEDIMNAAKKYYNNENRVTLYYLPKKKNYHEKINTNFKLNMFKYLLTR